VKIDAVHESGGGPFRLPHPCTGAAAIGGKAVAPASDRRDGF